MKIALTLNERAVLVEIAPKAGSYTLMKKLSEVFLNVEIPKEELEAHTFEDSEGNRLLKKESASYTKEIEFGEIVFEEIKKILKSKSESGELSGNMITLYEKFVEAPTK